MCGGPPKWRALQLAQEHVAANAHVHAGEGDGTYDADATWSQGEWEQA